MRGSRACSCGLWIALVAACSPDIPDGAYLCGPNEACPATQLCDEPTNSCVVPAAASAFSCPGGSELTEPDDSQATGSVIANLECVSVQFSDAGCLAPGDAQDWLQFTAPAGCPAVEVEIRISYKVAFEPLQVVLHDAAGGQLATDTACKNSDPGQGEDVRCLTQTITSGQSYGIEIKPAGGDDCEGACQFNRYTVAVQLATPS
ncbi:hypothetical protein BH11MYX1_BH11MYX1_04300 [soil metagenome]